MSLVKVVGLQDEFQMIWKWIMEQRVRMLAVTGPGGVGKTTLLRLIHDKLSSTGSYSVVIWVTVSGDFQIGKVQDEIWGRIGSLDQKWVQNSTEQKAKWISHVLSQNNFVLFLDDLWNPIDLSSVGVPDPRKQNESIVILSSRNRHICNPMGVQRNFVLDVLTDAAAWALFQKKVGEDILHAPTYIISMAKEISSMCCGLPILLCTVAGAMSRKKSLTEWVSALKVLRERVKPKDQQTENYQLLNICYEFLPNDSTKFCFLYFSLFPEDFTISKSDLIDLWISEEFFGLYHGRGVVNLGYRIIELLVGANLFEEENDNCVKMLDMIRDFALDRVMKFNFNNFQMVTLTKKERYFKQIGATSNEKLGAGRILSMKNIIQNIADVTPGLLDFFLQRNPFIMIKNQYKPELTVLDLSKSSIEELPRGISELVSLQHLNLSSTYIEQLPIELKKLKKLRCLNLENNDQLRTIPRKVISSLSSLQVLRMFRCGYSLHSEDDNILSATSMDISELHCLESLKLLSITITCSSALNDFFSTHILPGCTQALSLEVFWESKSLDISSVAAMEHLRILEIHYAEHLKDININFMMDTSFASLQEVNVEKCSNLQHLSWLILAPNLKILKVSSCPEMEEIMSIGQLCGIQNKDKSPFAKLKALELESLQKLNSIYWEALPFQFLKTLQVVDCPLLKKLPLNADSGSRFIEDFKIIAKEVEWEDGVTEEKLSLNANSGRRSLSLVEDFEIIGEEEWWKQIEWEDSATEERFSARFKMLPVERKWSPPVLNLQSSPPVLSRQSSPLHPNSYVVRSQSDGSRGYHQRFKQYFCSCLSSKLDC